MLIADFYKVQKSDYTDSQIHAIVELNANHAVFKGHFPDNPVTPGVCMLQIFKELSEEVLQEELFIKECTNVKFMALINPLVHPVLTLHIGISQIESEGYKIKAS